MFYVKNVPTGERLMRLAAGLAVAVPGYFFLDGTPAMLAMLGGIGFALTGVVGFCPMCALVGRKLDQRARVQR